METHTFYHAYITPSYIRTYIVLKNISFYIYIIVCVYRVYLYVSNIEYIEFGYFCEFYFNLHLFKILRYLAYLFGCDCFDSSLFVFTMNTLPPSAQPILGPFLLRFWEPLGGPLAVMTSTFEELLDASWCSFRVKILEVRRFRGLQGECLKKATPCLPSRERNNMLEFEHDEFQVQKLSSIQRTIVFKFLPPVFEDVLFDVCPSLSYLLFLCLVNLSSKLVLRTVSMIILRASGEPMLLNNSCWTTTIWMYTLYTYMLWMVTIVIFLYIHGGFSIALIGLHERKSMGVFPWVPSLAISV